MSFARPFMYRNLLLLTMCGQLVWLMTQTSLRVSPAQFPLVAAFTGAAALTAIAVIVAQVVQLLQRLSGVLVALDVAVLAAGCVVLASVTVPGARHGEPTASLMLCTAAVMGLGLSVWLSPVCIVALSVLALLGPAWDATPALPLFVLAVGLATVVTRCAAVTFVARQDQDRWAASEMLIQAQVLADMQDNLRRNERLLHETVLNTLSAIGRGGLTGSHKRIDQIRSRAQEALVVLEYLSRGGPASLFPSGQRGLSDPGMRSVLEALTAAGFEVNANMDAMDDLPDDVCLALRVASREALANIAKHSQAQRLWLTSTVRHTPVLAVTLTIRDDGVGFDPQLTAATSFGVAQISQGMADVGGSAMVSSQPGQGTLVTLEWEQDPQPDDQLPAITAMSRLGALGLFVAVMLGLFWSQYGAPQPQPYSLLVVVGVCLVTVAFLFGARLRPWAIGVAVAAAPLYAAWLVARGGSGAGVNECAWIVCALAGMLMVLALTGPSWVVLPLVAGWLLLPVAVETRVEVVALIVIGAAFAVMVRRDERKAWNDRQNRTWAGETLRAAHEAVKQVRERYAPLNASHVHGLLAGIRDGVVDFDDMVVRASAARHEQRIRSLMRSGVGSVGVQALASQLTRAALARNVDLRISAALDSQCLVPDAQRTALVRAMACTVPGSQARLSARAEGDTVMLRMVATVQRRWIAELRTSAVAPVMLEFTDPVPGRDVVTAAEDQDESGEELMWELSLEK